MKEEGNFILKRGISLPLGFGTGDFLVRQNTTKEKAIRILKTNPNNIQYFESYPENWQELISSEERTEAEETVILEMAEMLKENTKKTIKEHYSTFGDISGKKTTAKYIDELLKEAEKLNK